LPAPVLVVEHAEKRFGAVHALDDGRIELYAGEAHALVGENGAGKSTLVKLLAGVYRPDGGRILLNGEEAIFDNTAQSQAAGIAIIFQEPTLFPDLSVTENMFVGCQPLLRGRRIDARGMRRTAGALFERLGVQMDLDRPARGLSIADQQLVEIAKALSREARVVVMDEPTAALTITEVDRLFGVVDALRADGAAALFVSHRLEEVFRLCQRVTVMRDGRHVVTAPTSEMTPQSVIHSMVGRDLDSLYPKADAPVGSVVLKVEHLTREGVFTDVSFEVRGRSSASTNGMRDPSR
jgi:rhamnose transport system ATP-binding protein